MKIFLTVFFVPMVFNLAFGQTDTVPTSIDASVIENFENKLKNLEKQNFITENEVIDCVKKIDGYTNNAEVSNKKIDEWAKKTDELNKRIDEIDKLSALSKNAIDNVVKLTQQLEILAKKQQALEQTELGIYQANYQSAVANLITIQKDINPQFLSKKIKDFLVSLSDIANPAKYTSYKKWNDIFKIYVEEHKEKDATFTLLSSLAATDSLNTEFIPAPFYTGITYYINDLPNRKKELKAESQNIFMLDLKIAHFTHDKQQLVNNWLSILTDLEDLQKVYDNVINRNLSMLALSEIEFKNALSNVVDINQKTDFAASVAVKAAAYIASQKNTNPTDWKQSTYYQMMDVQNLRIKYGNLAYTIYQHIKNYKTLALKYKTDTQMGTKATSLETQLDDISAVFDKAFVPADYINATTRMYKIN